MSKPTNNFFTKYLTIDGQNPIFLGFICGLYPFLFYVSNNFHATNSWGHWGYFSLFFMGSSMAAFALLFVLVNAVPKLHKYKRHILFVAIIFFTAILMSYAATLLIKKKILLGVLVIALLISLKLFASHKKLITLLLVLCVLPFFKLGYKAYDHFKAKTWLVQPDTIEEAQFVNTPNVYMIQPDGYVHQSMMEGDIYKHSSQIYGWLEQGGFKVYDGFRSNYPASLNSNASLFGMKHHYFDSNLLPDFEMPYAREVISGNNPVVSIFKNNGYETFFVAEDEYFQQNMCAQSYDYFNIDTDDVAYFSKGASVVRDVLEDTKKAFEVEVAKPKFFFIEKCLPHHVHFYAPGERLEAERKEYLDGVDEVNGWIKETVSIISAKDPDAIIMILADHGGWVSLFNYADMFSTQDPDKINSIYANLAAVKWSGFNGEAYDKDLSSNVNVFRVLFAALSKNKEYLEHLEDNSSYNLQHKNSFFKGVVKVIDDKGNVVYEPY